MAWTYGFFNSVNGDRLYNAEQMSHIFEGLITDGVYESVGNKMAVQPNSGMTIQVATGRGWFNKHWVNNDSVYTLTLESSDVTLNRYVAVIVKVDDTDAVRSATLQLKYGEFATTPVKPTMTRSETVNEYCLAYVKIRAGVTVISASDIEDTRQDRTLCGWVTGLVDQITPDTLYTQFTAIFNEWFDGLVDIIDEDVETTLVSAMTKNVTITLDKDNWELDDGEYFQTVSVTGMSTTKSVIVSPTDSSIFDYSDAEIVCNGQATNSLTFIASTLPTTDIDVNIIHSGI